MMSSHYKFCLDYHMVHNIYIWIQMTGQVPSPETNDNLKRMFGWDNACQLNVLKYILAGAAICGWALSSRSLILSFLRLIAQINLYKSFCIWYESFSNNFSNSMSSYNHHYILYLPRIFNFFIRSSWSDT